MGRCITIMRLGVTEVLGRGVTEMRIGVTEMGRSVTEME